MEEEVMRVWNRRDFVKTSAMGLAMTAGRLGWPVPASAKVSLVTVGSGGREEAIRRAVDLIGAPSFRGEYVALKPNFNSAHAFPGGTHADTLDVLVRLIRDAGADRVVVPDRSGMGNTREVYEEKGVFEQAEKLGFEAMPLHELPAEGWTAVEHPDLHWSQGYYLGSIFNEVDSIVQTCCLKTHGFGGHFTLSLKNTIGMIAADVPGVDHQFMRELHSSPDQRRMIAEANLCYQPKLIVMDAIECFTDRGPHEGTRAQPNVILASTDRVAIDAVGVAILREKGTTEEVSQGRIFDLEQLKRAGELGIGVDRQENIEFVTMSGESEAYARKLRGFLQAD
ncbi:DUF362 domain-containing protein [Candidatus Zixiibacteriota bacterium]